MILLRRRHRLDPLDVTTSFAPDLADGHVGAFLARYSGRCSACGEWFNEGDPIVRSLLAGQYRSLLCCEAA